MSYLHLTEVRRLPEAHALRLRWSDGHVGELSYESVRGWCPCALCQGHVGPIEYHPPGGAVEPTSIQPVGNYAISIAWSDGHGTGIYKFDFLRDLCPCAECTARRGGAPPQPE